MSVLLLSLSVSLSLPTWSLLRKNQSPRNLPVNVAFAAWALSSMSVLFSLFPVFVYLHLSLSPSVTMPPLCPNREHMHVRENIWYRCPVYLSLSHSLTPCLSLCLSTFVETKIAPVVGYRIKLPKFISSSNYSRNTKCAGG